MEVRSEMWEIVGNVDVGWGGRRREHRGAGGLMDAYTVFFVAVKIGWKGTVISEAGFASTLAPSIPTLPTCYVRNSTLDLFLAGDHGAPGIQLYSGLHLCRPSLL